MKYAKRGIQRRMGDAVIKFLACAMVCAVLAGNAYAETIPTTATEAAQATAPATETTQPSAEETTIPQEGSADAAQEPEVAPERMQQTVDVLSVLLTDVQKTQYAAFLQDLRTNTLYAKQEVCAAIEQTTQLLTQKQEIDAAVLQLKEQLSAGTELEDESREGLLTNLDTLLANLTADPLGLLEQSLSAIGQESGHVDTAALEEQLQLAAQVQTALESYPDLMNPTAGLEQKIQALQEEVREANRKFILVYIGLAVAAVGLLMSIVAMVFAVRKPKAEPVDLSFAASRADVEALHRQNQVLNQQYSLLEKKISQNPLGADMEVLARRLGAVERHVSDMENGLTQSKHQEILSQTSVQKPAGIQGEKPALRGYLHLNYQSLSPELSVLTPNQDGEYALYEDGTLLPREPLQGRLQQINGLSGWKASGLLYLFNPQLDGVECTGTTLPESQNYYKLGQVLRQAQVRGNGGNYQLQTKGCVVLERM